MVPHPSPMAEFTVSIERPPTENRNGEDTQHVAAFPGGPCRSL